jgi:hypothetical protein
MLKLESSLSIFCRWKGSERQTGVVRRSLDRFNVFVSSYQQLEMYSPAFVPLRGCCVVLRAYCHNRFRGFVVVVMET